MKNATSVKLNKAKLNKGTVCLYLRGSWNHGPPRVTKKKQRIEDMEPRGAPLLKEIAKMREWNLGGQRWRIFKEGKSSRKKCLLKS